MKKLILLLMIFGMVAAIPCLVRAEDRTDRLNQDSSRTFSPGYVNAAEYQLISRLKVHLPDEEKGNNFFESAMGYLNNKLGRNTKETAFESQPAKPVLQEKTGATNSTKVVTAAASSSTTQLVDAAHYNVAIGTGTDQCGADGKPVSATNKMASEVFDINGTKVTQYYVGSFEGGQVGTDFATAVNLSKSGDIIIMQSNQTYTGPSDIPKALYILGGYDQYGTRGNPATSKDVINCTGNITFTGSGNTVIDGVTFNSRGTLYAESGANLTFSNCTVNGQLALYYGSIALQPNTKVLDFTNVEIWSGSAWSATSSTYMAGFGWDTTNMSKVGGTFNGLAPVSTPTFAVTTSTKTSGSTADYTNLNPYNNNLEEGLYASNLSLLGNNTQSTSDMKGYMLKALLMNESNPNQGMKDKSPVDVYSIIINNYLNKLEAARAGDEISPEEMAVAKALAAIMANPTEKQKEILDAVGDLLKDMNNVEKETGENPELNQASAKLLEAVANVLLAQGIQGDSQAMTNIFASMKTDKDRIVLEYNESTKSYYNEMKNLLIKNAGAITLDNLLSKNSLEKVLKDAPPSEIDRILAGLRAKQNKSFKEAYIIQEADKLSKTYRDPASQRFKEEMKALLERTTKNLSAALGSVKK